MSYKGRFRLLATKLLDAGGRLDALTHDERLEFTRLWQVRLAEREFGLPIFGEDGGFDPCASCPKRRGDGL